jgi:ATP-dependent DNA helicase
MYHGTPAERAELRRTVILRPGLKPKTTGRKTTRTAKPTKAQAKKPQKRRTKGKQSRLTAKAPEITGDAPLRRSQRVRKSTIVVESDDDAKEEEPYLPEDEEDDDDESEVMDVDEPAEEDHENTPFPIVLTTYEMIIKDRVHLAQYDWGYIVVDEGHRLKNLDCKLMKEIKKYKSAGRMILTGTPLHV